MNKLLGAESILWSKHVEIALVLWMSMPSGCPEVRLLGNALSSMLSLAPVSFYASTVLRCRPLGYFSVPLPVGAVYVGSGCKMFPMKPSVWLNPFEFIACEGSPLDAYYEVALLRPDLYNWLAPLASAHVLVCDCLSEDCICHARVLLRLLNMFGSYSKSGDVIEEDAEMVCPECEPEETSDDKVVVPTGVMDLNETIRGSLESSVSRNVGYPESWQSLISSIRGAPQRIFWEMFAGCAILTSMFLEQGWVCGPPIDVVKDPTYNLLDAFFVSVVIGLILEGRVMLLHLGPPCSSFSWAVNRWRRYAMRSVEFPAGFANLPEHREEKVRLGNALALVSVRLCKAQERAKGFWQFEQPKECLMFCLPEVAALVYRAGIFLAEVFVCAFGAPWQNLHGCFQIHL